MQRICLFLLPLFVVLMACESESDALSPSTSPTKKRRSGSPFVDGLRTYIDGRITHYQINAPGPQSKDNPSNPQDQYGVDHNLVLDDVLLNEAPFLTSTAPFTVSDCYPAVCPDVVAGAEHRPFYLSIMTYESEIAPGYTPDFTERGEANFATGKMDTWLDQNFNDPVTPFEYTEAECLQLMDGYGEIGLSNDILAVIFHKFTTIDDADMRWAVLKDIDGYIDASTVMPDYEKDLTLGSLAILRQGDHYHHTHATVPADALLGVAIAGAAGFAYGGHRSGNHLPISNSWQFHYVDDMAPPRGVKYASTFSLKAMGTAGAY